MSGTRLIRRDTDFFLDADALLQPVLRKKDDPGTLENASAFRTGLRFAHHLVSSVDPTEAGNAKGRIDPLRVRTKRPNTMGLWPRALCLSAIACAA